MGTLEWLFTNTEICKIPINMCKIQVKWNFKKINDAKSELPVHTILRISDYKKIRTQ